MCGKTLSNAKINNAPKAIHKSEFHQTNNVEIAALTAPRPLLLISDGDDWTRNVDKVEFPYIQKVYEAYGKAENVENVHLALEKHDYGYSKRKAAYLFFEKHLDLSFKNIPGKVPSMRVLLRF